MRAFALIHTLISGRLAADYSFSGRPEARILALRLDGWLDRHGAALGCLAVLLTFLGTIELVKHLLIAL